MPSGYIQILSLGYVQRVVTSAWHGLVVLSFYFFFYFFFFIFLCFFFLFSSLFHLFQMLKNDLIYQFFSCVVAQWRTVTKILPFLGFLTLFTSDQGYLLIVWRLGLHVLQAGLSWGAVCAVAA